jgi:hypothetical protein
MEWGILIQKTHSTKTSFSLRQYISHHTIHLRLQIKDQKLPNFQDQNTAVSSTLASHLTSNISVSQRKGVFVKNENTIIYRRRIQIFT